MKILFKILQWKDWQHVEMVLLVAAVAAICGLFFYESIPSLAPANPSIERR